MNVRDRVIELRRVKGSDLRPSPQNWRTHPDSQKNAFRGIVAELGFAGACLARILPDGSLMLIDGHLRSETLPDQEIPVLVTDLTEEEANKLLAVYDPLSAMAVADAAKLDELLKSVAFDNEAVDKMLGDLADANGLGEETVLRTMDLSKPPPMSWALIGIPTVRFGEIAESVSQLAKIPGITIETTVTDDKD